MSDPTDEDLERRALGAYWGRRTAADGVMEQPNMTEVVTIKGRRYVVLSNTQRTLRVYRVRNDGQLKRLVRVPAELGGDS